MNCSEDNFTGKKFIVFAVCLANETQKLITANEEFLKKGLELKYGMLTTFQFKLMRK